MDGNGESWAKIFLSYVFFLEIINPADKISIDLSRIQWKKIEIYVCDMNMLESNTNERKHEAFSNTSIPHDVIDKWRDVFTPGYA